MATTTKHTVTIPVQVDRDELLNNVMGASWYTWSWWRKAEYAKGCDWKTYPDDPDATYIVVWVDDPDYDEGTRTRKAVLTVNDIIRAVAKAMSQSPWIRWDDMDACHSDVVMQYAVLGDYVYA